MLSDLVWIFVVLHLLYEIAVILVSFLGFCTKKVKKNPYGADLFLCCDTYLLMSAITCSIESLPTFT